MSDDADRAARAYTDVVAVERVAPGMVRVVTWSDAYMVDARDAGCNCPDKEYHDAPVCKHEYGALASDVDRLPAPGIVTDDLSTRAVTDGGTQTELASDSDEDERPADCDCPESADRLPCFPCYLAGFTTVADR